MRRRPVVVIGSNCFTGSHFVDALLEDSQYSVVGISRSAEKGTLYLPYRTKDLSHYQFYQVDMIRQMNLLQSLLDEIRPVYLIQVAALSEVALSNFSPVEYFQTNTVGVVALCNFLRTRPYLKRYLHISSAEVYGSCSRPVTESDPFYPSSPYAASKAAADLYISTLVKNFNFPAITIRSTNVYGKHQQLFKIIPRTIIAAKQGKKVLLYGGGKAVKSFVHVRDVVQGSLQAMQSASPGSVYHFSDSKDLSVAEVLRKVAQQMGKRFEEITEPAEERLGEDSRYELDCTKAMTELGWRPQNRFDDGLREVVDWIEGAWEEIRGEPKSYVHRP